MKYLNYRNLIINFFYLAVLQGLSLLLPLVTYPYLIRILDVDNFGLVIYAQTIIYYFIIVINFGFNISATKQISVNRNDISKLKEIFSNVLFIKSFILLLTYFVLGIYIFFSDYAKTHKLLFLYSSLMCIYDVIFPIWYFQGIEKMKYITNISLISKLIFTFLIFFVVKTKDDYFLVPLMNGIGTITAGVFSLYIIIIRHKISIVMPNLEKVKFYFFDSWPIFTSNVSIRLYISANKLVIGSILGMEKLAYYDIAEKITNLFKTPHALLSQVIFPKISKEKNIHFIKKIFNYSIIINLILMFLGIIFGKQIINIIASGKMLAAYSILIILLFSVPIVGISNLFGLQILIPFGYNKIFSKTIIISALIYLFLMVTLWLLNSINLYSISIVTIITEIIVTVIMFINCKRLKLW